MARATPLVVLGITLLSACVHWGLCLRIAQQAQRVQQVQRGPLNSKIGSLEQWEHASFKEPPLEDLPADTPNSVDNPAHESGEGETLQEKEEALADLAMAEGETAVAEEAEKVLGELSHGDKVNEEELLDLEETVVAKQTQETLAANGALLTADDIAELHGQRMEEGGPSNDSSTLFEGDIVPSGPEQLALLQEWARAQKNGTVLRRGAGFGKPWPHGRVPFCFAEDVHQEVRRSFYAAVRVMHDNVHCLNFVEVPRVKGTSFTPERHEATFDAAEEAECAESPAIFVRSNPNHGCYSALGCVDGWRSQGLQLNHPGCTHLGVALHELGHALGMHHEHQRSDRDDEITIHWSHIQESMKQWFHINGKVSTDVPFAHNSIMIYGCLAFSKDNLPTITVKGKDECEGIGGRGGLSEADAEQLCAMYQTENSQCKVNPRTGHGCEDFAGIACGALDMCDHECHQKCCAGGGGMQVQCYADKPCTEFTPLEGLVPFAGWISGGGTLYGGWLLKTLPEALGLCEGDSNCAGFCAEVPPQLLRQEIGDIKKQKHNQSQNVSPTKHYFMFKDHWAVGGGDASGWTSFRVHPRNPL